MSIPKSWPHLKVEWRNSHMHRDSQEGIAPHKVLSYHTQGLTSARQPTHTWATFLRQI